MDVYEAIHALGLGMSIYVESDRVSKRLITKDPNFDGRKRVMCKKGGATVSCKDSETAIRYVLGDAPLNKINGSFSLVNDDDPVFGTFARALKGDYTLEK